MEKEKNIIIMVNLNLNRIFKWKKMELKWMRYKWS